MHATSTATAIIQLVGPTATYQVLKFKPIIESSPHSIEIQGFTIRRGDDRYNLDQLPLSRILGNAAYDDILFYTFEANEDIRSSYHEIIVEIPDYDESVTLRLRAVEYAEDAEAVIIQVEDSSGDWLPVADVNFAELLGDSFLHTLETSALEQMSAHTLDLLPFGQE